MSADHVHYQRKIRFFAPKLPGQLAGSRPGLEADMQAHARRYIIIDGVR
jgi:hypothetical protein